LLDGFAAYAENNAAPKACAGEVG